MSDISKEKLVEILDQYLYGWGFVDILKATGGYEGAKLAGFILGACFIDALAGFYAGVNKDESKNGSGKRFKDFIKIYLTQYDADELWEDLRCGLVHSYAAGKTYGFTDSRTTPFGFHLSMTPQGQILLNLEDFLSEIRKAYGDFRSDILKDNEVFEKAKRRFLSMGLMAPVTY